MAHYANKYHNKNQPKKLVSIMVIFLLMIITSKKVILQSDVISKTDVELKL